ncbi:hypothetical protein VK792_15320 [Mesobacterium sp. TK19101]|uniref:Sulfotransferase domain-containing protein n=1 Tax=Mesobacterium hydrothermale TaxID=3111907 RepID=A0ABU6HLC9_9RHOB|nr:hypothetical protein [Mesobacterium sp. TK19101]MEC3862660.1 hypothetical protein [Mesobacterium sp. TK19101]
MTKPIKRILVRGCPRSGNTMLYVMLCSCFENVAQVRGEKVPVDALVSNFKKVAVAKYPRPVTPKILGEHYEAAREFIDNPPEDALMIFIVRDPRDALMSKHGSFGSEPFLKSAAGWFGVMDEIQKVRDRDNVLVLRFEDIVADADKIQQQIAEASGLTIAGSFSNFNEMVEKSDTMSLTDHNIGELNGLRPLDPTRVYAYKTEPAENVQPIVEKILSHDGADAFVKSFGYDPLQ